MFLARHTAAEAVGRPHEGHPGSMAAAAVARGIAHINGPLQPVLPYDAADVLVLLASIVAERQCALYQRPQAGEFKKIRQPVGLTVAHHEQPQPALTQGLERCAHAGVEPAAERRHHGALVGAEAFHELRCHLLVAYELGIDTLDGHTHEGRQAAA